jgi:23S rRNA (cytidine1920-2'-O)/16S rRNA (cytidine1409-2'-O)-methyltransferase
VSRVRADHLLVQRGLFDSRARAQAAIAAGLVRADGQLVRKPSEGVAAHAVIAAEAPHPYVSRGGLKLAAALDAFSVDPAGLACLDIGASTGGFTDVLLRRGARQVTCVDTGSGQLHPVIAGDPRVTAFESQDIRHFAAERLAEAPALVVIDVSFISLRLVLPQAARLAAPGATLIALVKPQFEVGRGRIGKGGVVRDDSAIAEAIATVQESARASGLTVTAMAESPITGGDGNREHLMAARKSG